MNENQERTDGEKSASTEHMDPNTIPAWLMEAAKNDTPAAMGWLASGYLAGVEVARKAGQCGARERILVSGDTTVEFMLPCDLHYGHRGWHRTVHTFVWES